MQATENVIKQLISGNKGKIFSVHFVKKDGSLRKMICRTGVRKYLNDPTKAAPINLSKGNVITVFDMKEVNYRSFDLSRLIAMRVRGMPFVLED